jgi:uncharacterized protein
MLSIYLLNIVFGVSVPIPPLQMPIMDQAHLLKPRTVRRLNTILKAWHASGKAQMAVLIVEELGDSTLEEMSLHVAESWRLGGKQQDNGILLLIAVHEKKARLEVGYGLEGELPDATAWQWIQNILLPAFQKQRYDEGVQALIHQIIHKVDPSFTLPQSKKHIPTTPKEYPWFREIGKFVLVMLILWFFLGHRSGGSGNGGGGGGGPLSLFMLSQFLSHSQGRGSGSSGNSRDDFDGDGGKFGGGGAQGGW